METLYNWSIKRSGVGMSITHSSGKLTDVVAVDLVAPESGIEPYVVATLKDGRAFRLHVV